MRYNIIVRYKTPNDTGDLWLFVQGIDIEGSSVSLRMWKFEEGDIDTERVVHQNMVV